MFPKVESSVVIIGTGVAAVALVVLPRVGNSAVEVVKIALPLLSLDVVNGVLPFLTLDGLGGAR